MSKSLLVATCSSLSASTPRYGNGSDPLKALNLKRGGDDYHSMRRKSLTREAMSTTILVVDDEQEIRNMLDRHFRLHDYRVLTAKNGAEALEVLSTNSVDVVVSDIKMPIMDGVQLLRELRESYPMIRPIMITGYVTLANALSCLRYGASTCLFKPLEDLEQLDRAVEDAIAHTESWTRVLRELLQMEQEDKREV